MCDPVGVVKEAGHVVVNPIDYGLGKIGLGNPLVDDILGLNNPGAPKLPAPPPAPPPPPDPTDAIIRRAMAAERLRAARSSGLGSSYLTGPHGLTTPAPLATPKATGY